MDRTLVQVEVDLGEGRLALARQRLRGLVGSLPFRLDLRMLLAEVYRREGDLAQAGRWSYLDGGRLDHEVAAFERAYGQDPVQMMKALSWPGEETEAGSPLARERLRALRARAEAQFGVPVEYREPKHPAPAVGWVEALVGVGCGLLVLFAFLLVLVGVGSLAAHGLDVLLDTLGE